jgi:hypothetical protein
MAHAIDDVMHTADVILLERIGRRLAHPYLDARLLRGEPQHGRWVSRPFWQPPLEAWREAAKARRMRA